MKGSPASALSSPKDPRYRQSLQNLRLLKEKFGTLSDSRQAHACSQHFCQPQSELSFSHGEEEVFSCNLFMCKYGSVHLCTENECTFYQGTTGNTCPISGIQYQNGLDVSSYSRGDYRTWKNPHAERHQQQRVVKVVTVTPIRKPRRKNPFVKQLSDEAVQDTASRLITLLLYSRQRKSVIERMIQRQHQMGEDAKANYVRNQLAQAQLPFACDMYLYSAHHTSQPILLSEFVLDPHLHTYYCFVISQVWDVVQRHHVPLAHKRYENNKTVEVVPRLNFQAVALATLYIMRKGLYRNNVQLLPADDFLLMHLPLVNLLTEFGVEKSLVTVGDKLISDAYDNAIRDGAALADISLDMDKMPVKEEKQITQTDDGLVVLKMSSSGETLFMPTSRRPKKKT